MLPKLSDFGLEPPTYIRKINNRNHWFPEDAQTTLDDRARLVAEKLFEQPENKYSLWYVRTDLEFYGIVASLSANRTPKDQNIDFILMTENDLKEAGIEIEQVTEGDCIRVEALHFNAEINKDSAQKLCSKLLEKNRQVQRCKKAQTILILEHQRELGCKAANKDSQNCKCESNNGST